MGNGDVKYEWGEVCPSEDEKEKVVTNKLLVKPEGAHVCMESIDTPIEFKQSNRSAEFINGEEKESAKYIHQGELLHNLFAYINTSADIPLALKRLRMEGVITSDEQEKEIQKLATWALGHPKVKEWFSGKWELYNECAIIYTEKGEKDDFGCLIFSSCRIFVQCGSDVFFKKRHPFSFSFGMP